MSRGLMFFSNTSMTLIPATFASRILSPYTAGIVPLPGSPMPKASVRQFMELAVNIPEQEPQLGHAWFSSSNNSSSVMLPARTAPTASNTRVRFSALPFQRPASIGPPLTIRAGIFTLAAPMSIPGTILSQFGISIIASKALASAMDSMLSATSSREGSE